MLIFLGLDSSLVVSWSSLMASSLTLCLLGILVLAGEVVALSRNSDDGDGFLMEEEELQGLFEFLGALLDYPGWAEEHPQPCTDTPWPGVQCEIGEDPPIFHVTRIHIGPDIVTPVCKTSAKLSDSLNKLPYLKTLSIFNCFLTSPVTLSPSLFGPSSSLVHLALDSNPALKGEIPPVLAQVSSLKVLSLSQNNMQGSIPFELGGLVNLEQLDLSFNNLSGEIPQEIGGLKSLTILDLSWNSLEGPVPYSLGQLQLLEKMDLRSNKLSGRMAPDLGKLKRLVLLDFSHNFLNGPIPMTLSGLEQLQYLVLDHNPINSGIPLFFGALKRLTTISFSGCGLQHQIPSSLSLLENLTALSLDNNSLTGTVPSSLGSLPNLDQLNVSHNQLSGELQLPQQFIDRLGERLDVRGNSGLCTSRKIYTNKNISLYLGTPVCLDTRSNEDGISCSSGTEVKDNKICNGENSTADESKGMMQPSVNYHGNNISSSDSSTPCQDQHKKLLSCAFLLSLPLMSFFL